MTRVAIIAAMAGELKPFVRGWKYEVRNGVEIWRWPFEEGEWVAACAGAGPEAATRAFAEIERDGMMDSVVSIGWAGALSEKFQPGRAYRVSGVIDARTGERFPVSGATEECMLVTSAKVADENEKKRLATTYKAALVDMEAAGVARLAAMRDVPFHCIKGVSDGFATKLPDFNRFLTRNGQFQLARFVLFAILRPWYWPTLFRMGENSKRAAKSIAESLLNFLDERGHIRKRNGYPTLKR